jgi:hypothetical protein
MTTVANALMPLPEIVAEIRSYAEFATSTDLELIREAVADLKSMYRDAINEPAYFHHVEEIRAAHDFARDRLWCQYNAVAVAAKNLAAQ